MATSLELLPKDYNEPKTVCQAIRERRGGKLNKLDRMLLHSPAIAEGWNIFFQKLREETMIPAKLREITMCVVAVINKANYEFEAHAPLLENAGGTIEQIKCIKNAATPEFDPKIFSEIENDVIELTIQITRDITVARNIKARLLKELGARQLVELITVAAGYNLVSRFLVATEIHTEQEEKNQ